MGEAHISLAHQLIAGNWNTTSCVMYHVTLKARNNESINHIYIYIYISAIGCQVFVEPLVVVRIVPTLFVLFWAL